MTTIRKTFFVWLAAAVLIAAPAANAYAQTNMVYAENEKDNSSVFEFAFEVVEVSGEVVDQTNAAIAYASCENCQAVAVAIQIVFVMNSPEIATPENVSIAVNYECTACTTVALAYQYVVG